MQSKERTGLDRNSKAGSTACSPMSPDLPTFGKRNSPNWPNEWGTISQDSGSSDFLSQSVASSTSWSDELEGDLTKSLQMQMQIVEHTLYRDGEQELSARSPLREEVRIWQQQFPHLRVFGQAVKPSVACQTRSRHEEIEEQLEEIITSHGNYENPSAAKQIVDSSEIYKEKIKKAVIDQIFLRIWPDVVKKIEPLLYKAAANHKDVFSASSELRLNCDDSLSGELTSGFNSLTLIENIPFRPKSGIRSGVSTHRNVSAIVPVKPIVLECSIPVPVSNTRTSSALRRSPGRLSQPVKHPSPERLLSPLPPPHSLEPPALNRSATARRLPRARPQYDARTGRMINRDDARPDLRRNLKTSPPVPWSRHVTLPPIETTEIVPKFVESKNKRSASALFKGGRFNSGSRPNTSLTTKNQVLLSPLDSLQIKQTTVTTSRPWHQHHHNYVSCEAVQLKQSDQRQRWRNRTNVVKRY